MKIGIQNFKTIKSLEPMEIKPLNVISGVNSSGKTSFIQFLLLIKQTLELNAVNRPLVFNYPKYLELGEYSEVVYCKDVKNTINCSIIFSGDEINYIDLEFLKIKESQVSIEFSLINGESVINVFKVKYETPDFIKQEHWIKFFRTESNNYSFQTNSAFFNTEFEQIFLNNDKPVGDLLFTAFMPQMFVTEIENPIYPEIDKNPLKKISIEPKIKEVQNQIEATFKNLSYIGPLREKPKDSYSPNKIDKSIGSNGEFAAFFLEKEAKQKIDFYKIENIEDEDIKFVIANDELAVAVKYWVCDVFKLAKDIKAEEYKDEYIIKVVNEFGVETTIKHVGFGISQILPIIVEGLRMSKNGTLVLEQPEIHLHPKIQSLLYDFIHSLILAGKKIVVETHSDHFITRMRRRVAEDMSDELAGNINLVFVEEQDGEHKFKKLELTDLGSLTYFPKDFVEQSDVDYRAIVKAQAIKRREKRNSSS